VSDNSPIMVYENPTVPRGYAVYWLGDVEVLRCALEETPEDIEFDAIDVHPDDFAMFVAIPESVDERLMAEPAGSA
jgi:hypothetical protein